MKKILVVEDEYYARKSIVKILQESDLDIQVCGEAENGMKAIELLEEYKDIALVITDIQMQKMGGLELASYLHKHIPEIDVLILTAFENFDYAREALRYNVKDYIVKPIYKENLLPPVKKVLEKQEEKSRNQEKIKNYYQWEAAKNYFPVKTIVAHEELYKEFFSYNAIHQEEKFCIVVMQEEELVTDVELVNRIIQEKYRGFIKDFFFSKINEEYVMLLSGIECMDNELIVQEKVESMLSYFCTCKHMNITMGVGLVYSSKEKIYQSYNEALYALNQRLIQGWNRAYFYKNMDGYKARIGKEAEIKLESIVRTRKEKEINQVIHSILEDIIIKEESAQKLYMAVVEILKILGNYYAELYQDEDIEELKDIKVMFSRRYDLYKFKHIEELENYLKEMVIVICSGKENTSNTVPELMNVNATQYRALLKYDMIQPLDEYFDDYASDALKSYVKSGGEELQKCITNEDGEMMAIPAPAITAGGINEMWIRQDWLDSLGLEAPRTWDELVKVAEAFVTQDPDGNGEDDTIGILGPSNSDHMNAIGGNQYGLDPLFSSFQSYPQYWLQGEDGTVEYGSIQPETRDALEKISELYTNKLIDPEMLVRSDSKEPLLAGKVGIFFGPWWSGYTVADATLAGAADWQAYFTPLSEDGNYYTHMAEPTTQYVVASKACKNPEAAFKIVNYLIKNEQKWVDEGVSTTEMGTADFYPLYNTYDNADEIEVSYDVLTKYLAGEITMDDVDFSTHKLLKSDMEAVKKLKKEPYDDFSLDKWNLDSDIAKNNLPRLVAILVGDAPSVNEKYVPVYNAYNGQTETMETKWANLKKMEEETFSKIVMGKADISEFDTFVENWKSQGGDQILKEINEELSK